MNPEVKKLWVDALRSGRYKQGMRRLRTGNAYCCLGVLCDLYDKAHHPNDSQWHQDPIGESTSYLSRFSYLPAQVMEWADLPDEKGIKENECLVHSNDAGFTFKEIARIIEEKF